MRTVAPPHPNSKGRLGVDFINVFTANFYARGAQKRKKDSEVVNLFTLLGTSRVKAVRRTLKKLSPADFSHQFLNNF
jgi:hypothetical protein